MKPEKKTNKLPAFTYDVAGLDGEPTADEVDSHVPKASDPPPDEIIFREKNGAQTLKRKDESIIKELILDFEPGNEHFAFVKLETALQVY